jgi:hypothetical protein
LPESERLTRHSSDGVLGDRDEIFGEVGDDVAKTVTEIGRCDWR